MTVLNFIQNDPNEPKEAPPTPVARRTTPLALVFTDMVGSSAAKRAASLGGDASSRDRAYLEGIQTKHLRLVRTTLAEYHGQEIMTIGDSFFLTFEEVADAVRCAAAIQQRLHSFPIDTPSGPMQLRIGIHVGIPEFFENSWHGTDVDTAARVESAGIGRQILLSGAARAAAGEMTGITLRSLGTFALKGVGDVALWDADYDQNGIRLPSAVSLETQRLNHRVTIGFRIGYALLAVLFIVGGYIGYKRQHTALIGDKEPIILADLTNNSGDPVFDTTLTPALTIQLQQSPILNIVSHQHLRQSMKYLGKPADDPITPDLARQIGQREGIKAYLSGEVDKIGSSYVITLNAQNTTNGDTLATEQAQVSDKDRVLEAAGKVATQMRVRLGESLASIQKLDTPFGQATTPSLEAFRAYAMGDAEHQNGMDFPRAEGHYRQAADLDPNFAMAWARLGVVYNNSGQSAKSINAFNKAFALSKNVSERERLYIQGLYYQHSSGNFQRARDTMELAEKTYPLDISNWINLGAVQSITGDFEGSLESQRKALAIDSKTGTAWVNLLDNLISLDRLPEAEAAWKEMQERKLGQGTGALTHASLLKYLEGDAASVARILAAIEGRPDQYLVTMQAAQSDEFEGRYRAATRDWQEAQRQARAQHEADTEAGYLIQAADERSFAGVCTNTSQVIRAALALDKSKPTLSNAATVAALCNSKTDALPLLAQLSRDYPEDTIIQQTVIPQGRAALALADHQPAAAIQLLQGSRPFDNISNGAYLSGLAHLELHDGPAAVDDFQRATRYRGNGILSGFYGQGLLGLARAYTLANDKPNARKTYESLLALWKNADPDLPQLLAAKKEYAALN